jgi:hypothetical protein
MSRAHRPQRSFETQVLQGCEVAFETDPVTQPRRGAEKRLPLMPHRLAVPAHLAGFRLENARERLQQAGLAAAVPAFEQYQFPGGQREAQVGEQAAVPAYQE